MKKIGWVYEFSSILTLMGENILKKRLSETKETNPQTTARLLASFASRIQKFSSITIWFLNYSLTITNGPTTVIELRKNYSDVLLSLKREKGRKIVMEQFCGEGLGAVKSLFKELL